MVLQRRSNRILQRKLDSLTVKLGESVDGSRATSALIPKPKSNTDILVSKTGLVQFSDNKIFAMMEDELHQLKRELEGLDTEFVHSLCEVDVSTPSPSKRSAKSRAESHFFDSTPDRWTESCGGACMQRYELREELFDDNFVEEDPMIWNDYFLLENMENEEEWLVKIRCDDNTVGSQTRLLQTECQA